jgi:ElaB/YqjD/DUF883 family membrane-anchored ribosome-binding protein
MSTAGDTSRIKDETQEAAKHAGERVRATVERGTDVAGDVAERGAEELRSYAAKADRAVDSVAGAADDAAQYMHDADADSLMGDVSGYVKRHPVQATIVALVAGFMLARLFSR